MMKKIKNFFKKNTITELIGINTDNDVIEKPVEISEKEKSKFNKSLKEKVEKIKLYGKNEEDKKMGNNNCFVISRPKSFEDSRKISESVRNSNIVVFSLENLSQEEGQRLIDFISGASFAVGARIEKLTDTVIASIPEGTEYDELQLQFTTNEF